MELTVHQTEQERYLIFIGLSLLGCGLITLGSWIKIPFYPISFTLHTLAIFILALTQSPKQAFGSAVCYLIFATIGLPVLSGKANYLWMMGKSGGYLMAFPLAAYVTSKLAQKRSYFVAIFAGQALIYFFGFLWLIPLVGITTAWTKGVVVFLFSDSLKNLAAIAIASRWNQ